jgi:preprotein translocase subunit SecF
MNILKYQKFYFILSGLLILASILSLSVWHLKLGIDFKGGSLMEIEFTGEVLSIQTIKDKLIPLGLGEISVQPAEGKSVILRFKDIDEETHQKILKELPGVEEKICGSGYWRRDGAKGFLFHYFGYFNDSFVYCLGI